MYNYKCRVSNKPLSIITDFGKQPLGNGFLNESQYSKEYFFNMCVGFLDVCSFVDVVLVVASWLFYMCCFLVVCVCCVLARS